MNKPIIIIASVVIVAAIAALIRKDTKKDVPPPTTPTYRLEVMYYPSRYSLVKEGTAAEMLSLRDSLKDQNPKAVYRIVDSLTGKLLEA
jgi:hypothetical protein